MTAKNVPVLLAIFNPECHCVGLLFLGTGNLFFQVVKMKRQISLFVRFNVKREIPSDDV